MPIENPNWSNEASLLSDIQIVSFALDDVELFLDTHPNDENALQYFRYYRDMLQAMTARYNESFGPLTALNAKAEAGWDWVSAPWPWEKEA